MSTQIIITLAIFAATFFIATIIVALSKHAGMQATPARASLVSNVTARDVMAVRKLFASLHQPRRLPVRNERQDEHYIKASLAAMHAAHFHDHG
jgi:hypothetical protein